MRIHFVVASILFVLTMAPRALAASWPLTIILILQLQAVLLTGVPHYYPVLYPRPRQSG